MTIPMTAAARVAVPGQPPVPHEDHQRAARVLLMAQVELYCDHEAAAIVALRAAHRTLLHEAHPAFDALAWLDEAAWHIRHHEMPEALRAISRARDRLA